MNRGYKNFWVYFSQNILKKSWFWLSVIISLLQFFLPRKILPLYVKILIFFIPIVFVLVCTVKELFNEYQELYEQKERSYDIGLPDKYERLLENASNLLSNTEPLKEELEKINHFKKISLEDRIVYHVKVFNIIKNELDKILYRSKDSSLVITPRNSQIKAQFYDGYNRLQEWFDSIHRGEKLDVAEVEVKKYIDNMINTVSTLLAGIFCR